LAAASMAAQPPNTIKSASETCLPPLWLALKADCIFSRVSSTLLRRTGLLAFQYFWGDNLMRAPLAPPRLSESRKVAAEAQAVATNSPIFKPEASILVLRVFMSLLSMRGCLTAGIGSCQ